jgi:predicted dehydrogenase
LKHIAVIGAGSIGRRHVNNLSLLHPDATIYWLGNRGQINTEHSWQGVIFPTDLNALLAQPLDYCIIASPASCHDQHFDILCAHDIPLLVEKPLAATLAQASKMRQLAAQKPSLPLAVGYCLRFLPALQQLQQHLQAGILGKILQVSCHVAQYLPDWRPQQDYRRSVSAQAALGGGALLELSHELDYLAKLFGPLRLLHAHLQHSGLLELDVEDQADLVLCSEDNTLIVLHQDFLQHNVQRRCVISGVFGRLEWDLVSNQVALVQGQQTQVLYQDAQYPSNTMYLDMLRCFESTLPQNNASSLSIEQTSLASIEDAYCTMQLIAAAKTMSNLEITS